MYPSVGVSSLLSSSRRQHQHVVVTEKYLQAVKSLLKARSLDSENSELHVRTADFRDRGSIHPSQVPSEKLIFTWTVSSLPQPPPAPIGPILVETLRTLLPGDITLETFNSQYLQRHSSFPPAVLAAAKVSRTLGVPREELEALLFTTLSVGTLLDIKVIFVFEQSTYPSVSCTPYTGRIINHFLPRTDPLAPNRRIPNCLPVAVSVVNGFQVFQGTTRASEKNGR